LLYIYYLVTVLTKLNNNMLPKALVIMPFIVVITLGLGGDTSIQDNNL